MKANPQPANRSFLEILQTVSAAIETASICELKDKADNLFTMYSDDTMSYAAFYTTFTVFIPDGWEFLKIIMSLRWIATIEPWPLIIIGLSENGRVRPAFSAFKRKRELAISPLGNLFIIDYNRIGRGQIDR